MATALARSLYEHHGRYLLLLAFITVGILAAWNMYLGNSIYCCPYEQVDLVLISAATVSNPQDVMLSVSAGPCDVVGYVSPRTITAFQQAPTSVPSSSQPRKIHAVIRHAVSRRVFVSRPRRRPYSSHPSTGNLFPIEWFDVFYLALP